MGCDIHLHVEAYHRGRCEWVVIPELGFSDRNYLLFGMLADVRNGFGFAGVDTGDALEVISYPRGLPRDVTGEVWAEASDWGYNGHSHSFLFLSELLDETYWDKTGVVRGVVNEKEYREYLDCGKPNTYCGGVAGPQIEFVEEEEMDAIVRGDREPEKDTEYFTRVQWQEPYRKLAGGFYTEFLPELKSLIDEGSPYEAVRIVFWFDN